MMTHGRAAQAQTRPAYSSSVFQTPLVACVSEWLETEDVFHLGWSSTSSWREVQATLVVLKPRGHEITDKDLESIVRRFPNLRSLSLHDSRVTDAAFHELSSLSNLRELSVVGCAAITVEGVKALPKNLESLHMHTSKDEDVNSDAIVIAAARRCTRLRSLRLGLKNLSDAAILEVASKCVDLKAFVLAFAEATVTDRAIIELSKRCDLESVDLSYAKSENITDATVIALADNCPRLKEIELARVVWITDASILALSRCDSLETMCLPGLHRVSDASIVPLVTRLGANLLDLDVSGTLVSDTSVRAIAQHCGMMKALSLGSDHFVSSASNISEEALVHLTTGCPHLRRLDLTSDAISEVSLLAIARCCTELEFLSLSGRVGQHSGVGELQISDAGLIEIQKGCPRLSGFRVVSETITDLGLAGFYGLETFSLQKNNAVSLPAIEALIRRSPNLRSLNLQGCLNIRQPLSPLLQEFRTSHPKLMRDLAAQESNPHRDLIWNFLNEERLEEGTEPVEFLVT